MTKCAWASIGSNGKARGDKAGDQNGREVRIANFYNFGQTVIYRFKNRNEAERYVEKIKQVANNNHVGYNQTTRNTLDIQAKKIGYKMDKIKVNCDCDCSSLVASCLRAIGINVPLFTTGIMDKYIMETGKFEKITDKKILTNDKYLALGDIINRPFNHVISAIENGSCYKNSSNYEKKDFIKEVQKILKFPQTGKASTSLLKATITISARVNKNHELVTPLERELTALGYYSGDIEADLQQIPCFGNGMTKAVNRYQREVLGYYNTDGEITARNKMWKSLLGL